MEATLKQAQRFAALKKTKVFDTEGGHKLNGDGSITFVLMSGPKLTFTGDELDKEIKAMEKVLAKEHAILALDSEDEPKAKPKAKKEE
jgi:hypothetical protein